MEVLKKNVYRGGFVLAAVIIILCGRALYIEAKEDINRMQEEDFREFTARNLEDMLESMKMISACDVDFEVENNKVSKVHLILECTESLEQETEEAIKSAVAGVMNVMAEDISISY